MYYRVDFKLCMLWILLVLQVLLVIYYLLMAPSSYMFEHSTSTPKEHEFPFYSSSKSYPIKFVAPSSPKTASHHKEWQGYLTEANRLPLPNIMTSNYFVKLNNETECFVLGTDVGYTKRRHARHMDSTRCECKKGWHGKDCGQPEVIWRAFIASRQKIIPRRRSRPRRIIHGFPVIGLETTLAEIKLQELADVVDCFIVAESNRTATGHFKPLNFRDKLQDKEFLPDDIRQKLLYIPLSISSYTSSKAVNHSGIYSKSIRRYLWLRGKAALTNLRSDDLYVDSTDAFEIPNPKALLFFKLYDGWPQPVAFRLRWSAYGFFWQHPKKTVTTPGAYTVGVMEDIFHNAARISGNVIPGVEESDVSLSVYELVVGDLNHYGGWYCSWCLQPNDIVTMLQWTPHDNSPINWEKVSSKKIDTSYIEDLIGVGLWLDGVTGLIRKSYYRDLYFAPEYVVNNTWKYDFLYTNFYNKLDYNG
ncbi:beta-1,4-mannosyl-glycoprotein 4-beta-N-acetylglucosaminyltransferase [Periplaneta americana]|uniref:beta-1,4-mannosyl-glycoprotein 4-beta-N-acetylglucosaminyltransferase n=1 Tax=Periplaneta americana TaxID=6978 RepID=UPI0037E84A67